MVLGPLTLAELAEVAGVAYPLALSYVRRYRDFLPSEGRGRKRRFAPECVEILRSLIRVHVRRTAQRRKKTLTAYESFRAIAEGIAAHLGEFERELARITREVEGGEVAIRPATGPDHPLVRAFKASLIRGKPPEDWRLVVVHDRVGEPPIIIGTFVRTLGNRLLYFSAANLRLGKWIKGEGVGNIEGALLDHVTLDPPRSGVRREGHLTLLEREGRDRHVWRFRTQPRDGWHYWFSLLAPTIDELPRLPALISLVFSSGRADLRERYPDFAIRGGLSGMEMPPLPASDNSFVQLDVWVGEPDATKEATELRPIPFVREAWIVQEGPEAQTAQCHLLELGFPAGERIAVAVTRLIGHVRGSMFLRAVMSQ
jgi:hypothetical protein